MGDLTDDSLKGPFILIHRGGLAVAAFLFPMAPQSVRIEHAARGQIHQTLTGHYLEEFSGPNSVLTSVSLRGTFGYRKTAGGALGIKVPGSVHSIALEKSWEAYNALSRQLKRDVLAVQEYIQVPRLYFWRVWVDKLAIFQDKENPLLYFYDLHMWRLQDYLSPVAPSLPPGITSGSALSLKGLFG